MNGFVLFTERSAAQVPDPRHVAPLVEGTAHDLRFFDLGGCVLTWGHDTGDIWLVDEDRQALVILSGYVTEFESGPEFKSQKEAASYLLTQCRDADSNKTLINLFSRIYGSFGLVFHDYSRNITMCVTDRVSSRPLWMSRDGSGWLVSSHAAAVALSRQSTHIDLAGLGAFLLYGGPLAPSRSLFKDITAIPPGSIVTLDQKEKVDTSRWYQFRHKEDDGLSVSDWENIVADRLVCAADRVGKHCQAPAVFFSGGTDSRLTAAALKSAGISPLLVTLADSMNLEVRVARLASKALGLNQIIITRDPHWYLRTLPRMVYETGGNYVWTHGHFSTAANAVHKEHGADSFLLGDLCEAFSKLLCSPEPLRTGNWTVEEFISIFDSIRLPLYRPINREKTLSLLNQLVRKEVEEALRFEIEQRFKEIYPLSNDPLIVADLIFRWESVTASPTFFMFLDLRSVASERNLMLDRDVHQSSAKNAIQSARWEEFGGARHQEAPT